MRCEASVVGLMVKRLTFVVVAVLASEASAQGLMTVKGWGENSAGQCNTPSNVTGVTQVACGWRKSCCIDCCIPTSRYGALATG